MAMWKTYAQFNFLLSKTVKFYLLQPKTNKQIREWSSDNWLAE